jgi:hypothetical protein
MVKNNQDNKQRKGFLESRAIRKEQILIFRSHGYTIPQICDTLKIKSRDVVHNDIKSGIDSDAKGKQS